MWQFRRSEVWDRSHCTKIQVSAGLCSSRRLQARIRFLVFSSFSRLPARLGVWLVFRLQSQQGQLSQAVSLWLQLSCLFVSGDPCDDIGITHLPISRSFRSHQLSPLLHVRPYSHWFWSSSHGHLFQSFVHHWFLGTDKVFHKRPWMEICWHAEWSTKGFDKCGLFIGKQEGNISIWVYYHTFHKRAF